jgi:Mg-chelatase subunit ChlI
MACQLQRNHAFLGFSLGGLSGVGGARQRIEDHGTEDYFKRLDEDFDTGYSKAGFNSKNNVMGHRSRRYQHEASSSGNDEVDGLQSWSEDESESECGSGSASEEASEVESQQKTGPKKRGWFGHEDDLFKDSDSD